MKVKLSLLLLCVSLLIATATASTKLFHRSYWVNGNDSDLASRSAIFEPINNTQAIDNVGNEAPSHIQVILLTLRAEGFEPAEMPLPAGEYLLVVKNRSGLDEVDVRLVRENGEHMGQTKVGARNKDWKQRLKLKAGTYLLSEVNHPDWASRIVVDK